MQVVIQQCQLFLGLISLCLSGSISDPPADRILGQWLFPSQGSSVDIFRQGNRYFVRVAEVDQAGKENYGLVKDTLLILDLGYNGAVWTGGRLTHPKTGMSLNVEVHMNSPQVLTVTIYKGIKLLHRSFVMTRKSNE